MRAVLRNRSSRIHDEGTLLHHVARTGRERRSGYMRTRHVAVTTFPHLYSGRAVLSRNGSIAATEETRASHPDGHADRQQQSHHFVREEQTHLLAVYPSAALFVEVWTCMKIVIKFQHFCNRCLVSLKGMSIDKNKITTQDELGEPAPMDVADERAGAEMKELERQAKKDVAEGLQQQEEGEE